MELAERTLCGLPLIQVEGELDRVYAPRLYDSLTAHVARGTYRLLLDLEACTFIDSGGLGTLLGLVAELGDRGWLGVVGANAHTRRLFDLAGLSQQEHFMVFNDEEDACRCLAMSPS